MKNVEEGIRDVRKEVEGDGNRRRWKWELKEKMEVEVGEMEREEGSKDERKWKEMEGRR